ncbi:MAG TPA: L-dopachrome tautomerase-related protein [Nevskiaceae bacterium]|nr:L-dopachrome tautomerase-related protein [Nevskiaceae bacterium]
MRWIGRLLARLLAILLFLCAVFALALKLRYGGGYTDFPDRTGKPAFDESALEVVAELPTPPGNIAVSADGRVFVTLHPEAHPDLKVVELVNGEMEPFPDLAMQDPKDNPQAFDDVLSIRIDSVNRLWALDNGHHGLHPARLLAFDLATRKLVHEYTFPREIAGLGSHLNDFQVSPDAAHIYIADASFFAKTPALVVYDVEKKSARRLLENHYSVRSEFFTPVVNGRKMELYGLISLRPGVDSIALKRGGGWLAYGAVTSRKLYVIPTASLLNEKLSESELESRVHVFADKTMSDGLTIDDRSNVYITDPEHSAIVLLRSADQRLYTLVQSQKLLRWPDGLSFGPDGWLYVSCSALGEILGRTASQIREGGPYHVLRIKPGPELSAAPGQ